MPARHDNVVAPVEISETRGEATGLSWLARSIVVRDDLELTEVQALNGRATTAERPERTETAFLVPDGYGVWRPSHRNPTWPEPRRQLASAE